MKKKRVKKKIKFVLNIYQFCYFDFWKKKLIDLTTLEPNRPKNWIDSIYSVKSTDKDFKNSFLVSLKIWRGKKKDTLYFKKLEKK